MIDRDRKMGWNEDFELLLLPNTKDSAAAGLETAL